MVWTNRILLVLNLFLATALFWFLLLGASKTIMPGAWEYKDLVSVLLTVVTVVLAFIGVIVAGAAIWGYQSLKSIAEEKAVKTSQAGCDQYLKSPEFRTQIEAAIREKLEAEAKEAIQNALAPAVLQADTAPEFNAAPAGDADAKKGDEAWRD